MSTKPTTAAAAKIQTGESSEFRLSEPIKTPNKGPINAAKQRPCIASFALGSAEIANPSQTPTAATNAAPSPAPASPMLMIWTAISVGPGPCAPRPAAMYPIAAPEIAPDSAPRIPPVKTPPPTLIHWMNVEVVAHGSAQWE